MGAKSLELQIRVDKASPEPNAWPQHRENVLQRRHSRGERDRKARTEVSRYEKDISVKKETLPANLYSRCMERAPDYAEF